METATLALLSLATLFGAFAQAATGFGFAILAAPVFLWTLDSKAAIPTLIALHLAQAIHLVPAVWREAPRAELQPLAWGAVVGCPAGLAVLHLVDVRTLKLLLGILILGFVALFVWRSRHQRKFVSDLSAPRPMLAGITGVASGALTALLVMPGPPLMAYLATRGLAIGPARALSITFFAGCALAVLVMATFTGDFGHEALLKALLLLPALATGTFLGRRAGHRLPAARYQSVLLVLMLLSGLGALVSAM